MKLFYLLILSFLLLFAACVQQPDAISHHGPEQEYAQEGVFHKTERPANEDTNQIKALIQKGNDLIKNLPDSALRIYEQALNLSYNAHYKQGIATALMNLGDYYYIYTENPNYRKARSLFQKAIMYSQLPEISNKKLFPGAYISIGNTFYQEGQYDSANYAYFRALAILQSRNPTDTEQLTSTYMNIGAVFGFLDKDYTRFIQYTRKAEQLAAAARDTLLLIRITRNLGTLYDKQNKPDSCLRTLKYALELARGLGVKQEIQHLYIYVSNAYLKLGEIAKGKVYQDSAENIDKKSALTNKNIIQNRGYIYFLSGQFSMAIPYYKRILSLSTLRDEKGYVLNSYSNLAQIYDTLGQWQQAAYYLKAYMSLKDSLLNEEKIHAINQLEIKYKSMEKDRLLAAKDLEIAKARADSQQRIATIWITSLCILLLLSFLFLLRYRQANKLKKLQQEKELELLKASMAGEATERVRVGRELHDGIGGLLSAIKLNLVALRLKRADIAAEQNFMTTIELADQAAAGLRETAHNLVPSGLLKHGLFKTIQEFCLRVGTPTATRLEVTETGLPKRLETTHELVIYRIVQELIHNILKHAGATEGQISLSWQDQLLLITVEDNGTGISSRDSDGIGLENIRKGIERLKGAIDMESIAGEGTSVYLEFPI